MTKELGRTASVVLAVVLWGGASFAASREPEVFAEVGGDPVYTVLPAGAIPAILEPEFVSGEKAASQMLAEEPVLGIVLGGEARAYSLWQLDGHEIVNDTVGGIPIVVSW